MLRRTKIVSFKLKQSRIYASAAKSRMIRKVPDCKFEPDCPPKKCIPPVVVCHTLPKQKCVITVKPRLALPEPPPPPQPPCVKVTDCTPKDPYADLTWWEKMLPDEEKLSPTGKMAYRFLKYNVKAFIAGGTVYATAKAGVWGTSEQSADLYKKSHDSVMSYITCHSEKAANVPDSRELVAACKHYWNKGVICTISSLVIFPRTLKKWSKELYKQIADNLAPGVKSPTKS